ncbi:extracellular solute-binding protein [Streptomyces sp. NPDC026673]|uniref:extracellular solute-binding protein n=1 Tax=Streptomyces sp. NPDC026673 TaxID=3155724 RepID=UPI0033D4A61C
MTLVEGDPRSVGGYRLEGRLGAGGMGVVYLARSVSGRRLAVKVVRPEFAADDGFRDRFRREVAAARRVSGAFTAPVVDADADAEQPWLATLFVPGPTLSRRVAEAGPLPVDEVWRLSAGLVEALRDIHRAGLVHRDLKPGNVLLAGDGPRVIDFGIARAAGTERLTRTGTVIGTPAFMAPEQFGAGPVGPACDVFALGAVLVYAATGHVPFDGDGSPAIGFRVVYEEPDLGGLPAELRPFVEPCLAKDPPRRPAVEELLAFLTLARAGGGVPGPEPVPSVAEEPGAEPDPEPEPSPAAADAPGDAATRVLRPRRRLGAFGPPADGAGAGAPSPVPGPGRRARSRRAALAIGAVLAAASLAVGIPLLVDGPGSGGERTDSRSPSARASGSAEEVKEGEAEAVPCAGARGSLTGAGSSAAADVVDAWIGGFEAACPGATVAYRPTGSGAGTAEFLQGRSAFALADAPLDAELIRLSRQRCRAGGRAVELPLFATPVAVAYHLPGVTGLVLDPPTLARIFDERITRWDDPAIGALNPGVTLPSRAIVAVHRADATAGTRTFTGYLRAAAPEVWPYGAAANWPGRGGEGVSGAGGAAERVARLLGAIGYLDLGAAGDLDTVLLDTGAAEPVAATAAAATRALAGAGTPGGDGGLPIALEPAGRAPGAYPVARVGYAVVCDKGNTRAELASLRAFLLYAASGPGQSAAVRRGQAGLPDALAAKVRDAVRGLA